MKKFGLLLALVTISIFASHAQSEPLAKYRIVDAYEDANTDWRLYIGYTQDDLEKNRYREEGEGERNTLMFVNRKSQTYFAIKDNVTDGMTGDYFVDAKFGLDPNGQRPKYIYYSVSAYATDNEVHCYNLVTETCNVVHFGDLIHVLPSGNVVVQCSGFAQDQNGHELPGRGLFDYVVSPTGKVLWKSSIYGQ